MAIGTLFNDIQVVRLKSDGSEDHRVTVPLSYAPREKFIRRLEQDYGNNTKVTAITLPRMAYELISLNYDPQKKLQKARKFSHTRTDGVYPVKEYVYTPVPFDFMFSLNIVTKTQDEMMQIVEQIVPGFTPDLNITIKGLNGPDSIYDIPVALLDVMPSDSYEGGFDERRQILWSMTFMLKGYLFGPTGDNPIILLPDVKFFDWNTLTESDDG